MEIARERQHQLAVKQKEQEIEEARQMALAGYPIEQIATLMHHPYKTDYSGTLRATCPDFESHHSGE